MFYVTETETETEKGAIGSLSNFNYRIKRVRSTYCMATREAVLRCYSNIKVRKFYK